MNVRSPCRASTSSHQSPSRQLFVLCWYIFAALVTLVPVQGAAHSAGQSYLYLQIYEERISGRFEIALPDLNPALGLSGTDLEITQDNLDEHVGFLQHYVLEHAGIFDDRQLLSIDFRAHEFLDAEGGYVLLPFDLGGFTKVPDALTIEYSILFDEEPSHRGFLLVEHNWATGTFANENRVSLVFGPSSRRHSSMRSRRTPRV